MRSGFRRESGRTALRAEPSNALCSAAASFSTPSKRLFDAFQFCHYPCGGGLLPVCLQFELQQVDSQTEGAYGVSRWWDVSAISCRCESMLAVTVCAIALKDRLSSLSSGGPSAGSWLLLPVASSSVTAAFRR